MQFATFNVLVITTLESDLPNNYSGLAVFSIFDPPTLYVKNIVNIRIFDRYR